MRLTAVAGSLLLMVFASPSFAAGIDGTWRCLYGREQLTVSIADDHYTLTNSNGERGAGGFAFALPDHSVFNLDGYLADKFHVVGGRLQTSNLLNTPELEFVIAGGDGIDCTQ